MSFITNLHSRLIETKQFVDILKAQLDHLTTCNPAYSSMDNWTNNCSRLISTLKEIQKHVLSQCSMAMDSIQNLCEILGENWLTLRQLLDTCYQYSLDPNHLNLKAETENLLGQLVKRTFVVSQQPPQVLKTNTRFPSAALSSPVVVIVHDNQKTNAWGTITWDKAFASPSRIPFLVPDKVQWATVGQLLSTEFNTSVGCYLNSEDLSFLAAKAFRDFNLQEYNSIYLSWGQFSKENLPGRNFTFWEWFYSILRLTREHLKDLWRPDNRLVYGFISRKQTEDVLMDKPDGTFLLRYSETELGCITIAYKAETKTGDQKCVYMIKPFSQKDIQIRSLADRIYDLKHLKYLYPETPKDQVFGRFYEPMKDVEPDAEGYIPQAIVTSIPEWAPGGGIDSYPNTPHSIINTQSPSMNESYGDSPSLNSKSSEIFKDVDLFNLMHDIDFNIDDFPYHQELPTLI
ncbi:signal transducer and activator of transcription 5B-like isoform X2 [Panonychus citri]|uniref:signal transducer and activator of transcription 5B-like isoform X2 n=1 Tax=Panonychus citri TaxID=50023 RepID=UPI0023077C80|nr:signal transducer and activator of transcription 5B-like isoform X2 [Panonychus citri]